MIPHVIHQTWKTAQLPDRFRALSETWKTLNPDWNYRFWSDRDLLDFVATHYPNHLDLFCSYRSGVQRADAARYMLLHHFGGVYADIDAECICPLTPLDVEARVIIGQEPKAHWTAIECRGMPFMLFNGVMASPAKHPFWLHLLNRMADSKNAREVLDSTGPYLLTGSVLSYPGKDQIRIESETFFCPIDASGNAASGFGQNECYAVHHWAGTWYKKTNRTNRFRKAISGLARKFYAAQARLSAGKILNPETARSSVSPKVLCAPLPEGNNIAILVPVRNAGQHIAGFLDAINRLTVPKTQIKLVFCEGDSLDGTYEKIRQLTAPLKPLYRDIILLQKDTGTRLDLSRRQKRSQQRIRRAGLAVVRNHLIDQGLDASDDWALWIDADVWKFPEDIVEQLIRAKAKIVTPNCVIQPGGQSFDLNSFSSKPIQRNCQYFRLIKNGLFQPPPRYPFRLRLSDLRHSDRVPLDSVGGTMLLVDAALHRGGLRFPELPYDNLIETEAFGRLAKDCGVTPVGLPRVEIFHVPW